MSLGKFKKDLANVKQQIEQLSAQYNLMVGQRVALEHVINELENPAPMPSDAASEPLTGEIVQDANLN